MDILRYTNPPQMEREQFKIIKPPPQPGFDDSVTTIKETRMFFCFYLVFSCFLARYFSLSLLLLLLNFFSKRKYKSKPFKAAKSNRRCRHKFPFNRKRCCRNTSKCQNKYNRSKSFKSNNYNGKWHRRGKSNLG